MSVEYLARAEDFLPVASRVGSDLSCFLAVVADCLQIVANLLAARAGCIQVVLCLPFNLWRPTTSAFHLIAKLPQTVGQFGLVYGGRKLLRLKEAARLQGARLSIFTFSDVKNHRMGMKLWRGVTVNRTCGVVLKFGDDRLAGGLCWVIASDPRLGVSLQLVQSNSDTLTVGYPDAMVAAHERR